MICNIDKLRPNCFSTVKSTILIMGVMFFGLNVSAQKIDQLASTPPMGWNSWDCFGMDVTENQVKATADYMAENLKQYGWKYIVLDMGWNYGKGVNTSNFMIPDPPQCIDTYGRLIPNPDKFPSSVKGKGLKNLADYVHKKGLKFGIHIMRGIPWQAVEKNTPVKGTGFRAKNIATEVDACRWFHGLVTVDMSKAGAQEYYNSILEMYAEWGIDYIKADDMLSNPYHKEEIEAVAKAIKKSNRTIVLSLSPGRHLSLNNVNHLRQNANLWRISGDMWDTWQDIEEAFKICRQWQNYIQYGHWPDCDILPLGKLRINGTDGMLAKKIGVPMEKTINEYSRLTNDEKFTLFTLWSIFRSPLMMGGDLLQLDEITSQILTNKEVLSVNQQSTNNYELRATKNEIVWVADDPDSGGKYLAFFNLDNSYNRDIKVDWKELGISGKYTVRDLWKKKKLGKFSDYFETEIKPHGCGLYKIYD